MQGARGNVKKQGKILRDAKSGPGLLIVEGQQFPLPTPGPWRSELAPVRGMSVEVEFGFGGDILTIRPVPEDKLGKVESRASRIFSKLFTAKLGRE